MDHRINQYTNLDTPTLLVHCPFLLWVPGYVAEWSGDCV
jgi:hypothetical protein